ILGLQHTSAEQSHFWLVIHNEDVMSSLTSFLSRLSNETLRCWDDAVPHFWFEKREQCLHDILRSGITIIGVKRHHPSHNGIQLGGNLRSPGTNGWRRLRLAMRYLLDSVC